MWYSETQVEVILSMQSGQKKGNAGSVNPISLLFYIIYFLVSSNSIIFWYLDVGCNIGLVGLILGFEYFIGIYLRV